MAQTGEFEAWYDTVVKYVEPADIAAWMHDAWDAGRASAPAPVAQGEPKAWGDLLREAEAIVKGKPLWKRFIDGTPLANDIAVWMADFAREHSAPAPVLTPAQSLTEGALKTIAGWLADDMEEAVKNGANAVSMPDELVEIAAWIEARDQE